MSTASNDLHATVEASLRSVGQRYTPKRRALVTLLERADKPLSMNDLLAGKTGLPQSSIYRNLAVLEQAGAVRRVITEDEFARFELTEALTEHHHHLICSNCGKVEDVTIPADLESAMDRTIDRVARRAGFAHVSHRLDLIGTCRSCADAATA
ncbi:MAG TPA: Fur family transcriptional regulator [Actinomycetota bacterium]|jgi:Fe2+ or Zn2+ uptake regulation protein|nr:Fur family transcriptional regulator [Actinomycetota bacterium]